MSATELSELAGMSLGSRAVTYHDRDTMLYALAVGARASDTELVYEAGLVTLPTFALVLGQWVIEAAGDLGAYDRLRSLHAAQSLEIREPLPAAGTVVTRGRVAGVWDKGKASLVDIEAESDFFSAVYSIFLPGTGGWGGPRSAAATLAPDIQWTASCQVTTLEQQAAIYRLTGDRHPLHIDPAFARESGFDRPILHGMCTLGMVARELAGCAGAHPADLRFLSAQLAAPVRPGDVLDVSAATGDDGETSFAASVTGTTVLRAGRVRWGTAAPGRP